MSDRNVVSLFRGKTRHIAIVMDEIDGMSSGDKGGINSLIKLVRPKKTKKQKLEDTTLSPIICIGSYHLDKKLKELMNACQTIELKSPTDDQMARIVLAIFPHISPDTQNHMVHFANGDLRKLNSIIQMHVTDSTFLQRFPTFLPKSGNANAKQVVQRLFQNNIGMNSHNTAIDDSDRTVVALLWHENVIDLLDAKNDSFLFYRNVLDRICCADRIDRTTFQKQIWQFNEMSSLIKTLTNNADLHSHFARTITNTTTTTNTKTITNEQNDIDLRFTKVLTKYSTEYNHETFINSLCQRLRMDKMDLFAFFNANPVFDCAHLHELKECYGVSKLDVNRMHRYTEKSCTAITQNMADDVNDPNEPNEPNERNDQNETNESNETLHYMKSSWDKDIEDKVGKWN